jgi:hypothetical protein
MNKLMLFVVLATAACGGSSNNSNPPADAPTQPQADAAAGIQCFSGTAVTNDQLINACVDEKAVTVIRKMPMLPLMNTDGTLPPLP